MHKHMAGKRHRMAMNVSRGFRGLLQIAAVGFLFAGGISSLHAQQNEQDAKALVSKAVKSELAADAADHSVWRYRDDQQIAHKVSIVVTTRQGSVKRLIEKNGQPLSASEAQAEEARLQSFIHNSSAMQKQKRDAAHDDRNATELLKMLPAAFIWKVEGRSGGVLTLHFEPDPNFNPPDMQSRVLGAMNGELKINEEQQRIQEISGKLTRDVTIGWGLLGRLHQGGTFRVERKELSPRVWQIVETHVHIEGKALLFKNIGQQQDEVQSDFTRVPESTTLEQAVEMSKPKK